MSTAVMITMTNGDQTPACFCRPPFNELYLCIDSADIGTVGDYVCGGARLRPVTHCSGTRVVVDNCAAAAVTWIT